MDRKKKVKPVIKKPKTDEVAELRTLLLRTQADFENFRKRSQKEKEEYDKFATTDLVLRLIPTLDHFKLALRHLPKDLADNEWVKGIWHIERQLEQTLADEGVEEIKTVGEKYDHNLHEAIEEVEGTGPPGIVTEEVQKGYQISGRVIRPAKVRVRK